MADESKPSTREIIIHADDGACHLLTEDDLTRTQMSDQQVETFLKSEGAHRGTPTGSPGACPAGQRSSSRVGFLNLTVRLRFSPCSARTTTWTSCRYFTEIFENDWKSAFQELPEIGWPEVMTAETLGTGGFIRVDRGDYEEV